MPQPPSPHEPAAQQPTRERRRTLLVTNDFPPRQGGIQSFIYELACRQPAQELLVYCSDYPGAAQFDARQPFTVIRHNTGMLLPTPAVARAVCRVATDFGARAAWFGAAAPLGLLAGALRREAGIERVVALTHGHEVGWAMLPGARQLLRRIAKGADVVTYLGEYTRRRLAPVMGSHTALEQLAPGVDLESFHAGVDGDWVRERFDLVGVPVVVCVSRLVPRKGQDTLIKALPLIRRQIPQAKLLIVGDGRYHYELRELASKVRVSDAVVFTGAVAQSELAAHFAAGDVFAMPCRTRRLGMDVEGLGIVYLEASATGLPVVAGDSGGAPDAVLDGQTGYVVDGRDVDQLAQMVSELLANRDLAARMGAAGRHWVQESWRWDQAAARLRGLLDG